MGGLLNAGFCYFFAASTLIFYWGCASKQSSIPLTSQQVAQIKAHPLDDLPRDNLERYWLNLYFSGKKYLAAQDLNKACLQFEKLFIETAFPLQQVVNLKLLESCYQNVGDLVAFWDLVATSRPHWYHRQYLDLSLNLAKKHQLPKYEVMFLQQLAMLKTNPDEKLEKLEEALSIAEQNHLADDIKNLQQAIIQVAPRKTAHINSLNIFKVANDFVTHRDFEPARKLYRQMIDNPRIAINERLEAFNRLRFSFKLEGQKDDYLNQTQFLINFIEKQLRSHPQDDNLQKNLIRYQIILGRIYWTQHQTKRAQQQLTQILGNPHLDDANLSLINELLAGMELENNNFPQGIEFLQKALSWPNLASQKRWNLMWSVAWAHYLAKNNPETLQQLQDLVTAIDNKNAELSIKGQFWIGKIYLEQKNLQQAQAYLEPLLSSDEFGYYGILAHYLLGKKIQPFTPPALLPQKTLPVFDWLEALDENDLAQRYLLSITQKHRNQDELLELLPLFSKAQLHSQVIWSFTRIPPDQQTILLKDYLHLLYPVVYSDLIDEQAKEKNLPKEYILAIMRQESTFNPYARSPADALGLMQIIPSQAFSLAKDLHLTLNSKYDLYGPKINIQLGTELLRQLAEKSNGQKIFSSAAYNAGEYPLQHWLQKYYQGDAIAFVENISYRETRGYIKMIIRNLVNYQRLTAHEAFYFPQQYLQGLESLISTES